MHMYSTNIVAYYLHQLPLYKLWKGTYIYIIIYKHVYIMIIMGMYDHINILEANLYITYIYKLSYIE